MTKVINHFIGLIAFPLVLGGCVVKKDFVRYKKHVRQQGKVVQIQQAEANKKQANRIQWLERRLRQYKKLQRLQRKKDKAGTIRGFLYFAKAIVRQRRMVSYMRNDLLRLARASSYVQGRVFYLAENIHGDGVHSFMAKGYYRAGNKRMALLYFSHSIRILERRIKLRKAKCGKKSCKLYLADSLYGRALIYSMWMKNKKALKDLHRLDKLKLLKKYKFWENPGFEKLWGLPAWLKLVKKYKKEKKK